MKRPQLSTWLKKRRQMLWHLKIYKQHAFQTCYPSLLMGNSSKYILWIHIKSRKEYLMYFNSIYSASFLLHGQELVSFFGRVRHPIDVTFLVIWTITIDILYSLAQAKSGILSYRAPKLAKFILKNHHIFVISTLSGQMPLLCSKTFIYLYFDMLSTIKCSKLCKITKCMYTSIEDTVICTLCTFRANQFQGVCLLDPSAWP